MVHQRALQPCSTCPTNSHSLGWREGWLVLCDDSFAFPPGTTVSRQGLFWKNYSPSSPLHPQELWNNPTHYTTVSGKIDIGLHRKKGFLQIYKFTLAFITKTGEKTLSILGYSSRMFSSRKKGMQNLLDAIIWGSPPQNFSNIFRALLLGF